jgi:peptidoglycan biosynthesis protein MviN/MurJ (putative lipid II flippase)
MALNQDAEQVRRDFLRSQGMIVGAGVILALATCAVAQLVVGPAGRLLKVDGGSFVLTFQVFMLGLPAALSAALSLRLFLAYKRTDMLLLYATILVVVNVVGDYLGATLLGVEGIALASTVVRYSSAALYLAWLGAVLATGVSPVTRLAARTARASAER